MASIEIKDLEKQTKQLKASYDMWERTIKETIERLSAAKNEDGTKKYTQEEIDDRVKLLREGESDIIEKWTFLGGTLEELKGGPTPSTKPVVKKKASKTVAEKLSEVADVKEKPSKKQQVNAAETVQVNKSAVSEPVNIPTREDDNPLASYDIISLPSKGECYKNKAGKIAVSYLTAMDENIIVSPNLYRDNMVLDIILKEKIRSSDIDPDDLLDGDRDAIILFLRSSAYGNMYSVTATDPETQKTFEAEIDLSKLKYRDFTLVGDENGYFDYKLPISGDLVKFKFLTHKDYANLAKLDAVEIGGMKKDEITRYNETVKAYMDADNALTENQRTKISEAMKTLQDWVDVSAEDPTPFSHRTTNELEMQIVSINGNEDRKYIHDYIARMPIKDSTSIRKYISSNTPGVDYNFELEKPESLGGGSVKVFLQFDQFIFLVNTQ